MASDRVRKAPQSGGRRSINSYHTSYWSGIRGGACWLTAVLCVRVAPRALALKTLVYPAAAAALANSPGMRLRATDSSLPLDISLALYCLPAAVRLQMAHPALTRQKITFAGCERPGCLACLVLLL